MRPQQDGSKATHKVQLSNKARAPHGLIVLFTLHSLGTDDILAAGGAVLFEIDDLAHPQVVATI